MVHHQLDLTSILRASSTAVSPLSAYHPHPTSSVALNSRNVTSLLMHFALYELGYRGFFSACYEVTGVRASLQALVADMDSAFLDTRSVSADHNQLIMACYQGANLGGPN
jgi:hypothetical protein